ncbi:MAG: class I mannose-6-phosphate isomerase, partial [Phycisphaerae bacterium]|nr:class I mannose-6-phosphate isomerase [Phycisphaerae bacterium]
PIYKEKIWGGRNLQRLFDRDLPPQVPIGESWELADLHEGVSIVANGPTEGRTLTDVTAELGETLLGRSRPMPNGRFPLLLKILDATDILSLQVHPDDAVAKRIPDADPKTECWYILESRDGYIYKGMDGEVSPEAFRKAIESDSVAQYVRRIDLQDGDFHFLPAGTVHAIGPGLVIAEVQTPSDTTYRVTDWGRGREIHVERSMECIHFEPASDEAPGADGETLLVTDYFTVAKRTAGANTCIRLPGDHCSVVMFLEADGVTICHDGEVEPHVSARAGDTVLLPAALSGARLSTTGGASWLEITLAETGAME